MNLEQIKDRRAELVEHELDSDIVEMFCWLIDEVERLQSTLSEYANESNEDFNAGMETAAIRCTQIACSLPNWLDHECDCEDFDAIGAKITDEFGLEE